MKKWFQQLGKDTIIYGIGGVVARGVGFFLLPVYTRIFTPADYGKIELLVVICAIVGTIVVAGTDSAMSFYFNEQSEHGRDAQGRVVTSVLQLRLFWGAIVIITAILLSPLIDIVFQKEFSTNLLVLALVGAFLSRLMAPAIEVFRLSFRPWRYVGIALTNSLLTAAAIIVLVVRYDMGVLGYFIGICTGAAAAGVVGWWGIRQYLAWSGISRDWWTRLLKFGIPLVPAGLAMYVLNTADRWCIMRYHSDTVLGIYAVGAKFALLISLIVLTFRQAWWPTALKAMHDPEGPAVFRTVARLYLGGGTIAIIWLTAVAPFLTAWLTPPAYHQAFRIIGPLSWSALLYGFYLIACAGIWKAEKTIWTSVTMAAAAILNVLLNFLLVPKFGGLGAAIGTSVSFLCWNIAGLLISERLWRVGYALLVLALQVVVGSAGCCIIHVLYDHERSAWMVFGVSLAATVLLSGTLLSTNHWRHVLARFRRGDAK
jgi:O-antigen/teichoic acid export membrane protein